MTEAGGREAWVSASAREGLGGVPGLRVFANPRFRLAVALLGLAAALYLSWSGLDGYRQMQDFRNGFVPVARFAWHGLTAWQPVPSAAPPGVFLLGGRASGFPPPMLFLLWPWTVLPAPVGELAWFLLELAAAAGVLVVVYSRIGRPGPAEAVAVAAVLLTILPFRDSLNDGQLSIPIGFCLAVALWAHQRRRPVTGGLALALAAVLKVTPIAAVAYFAWRRDWRLVVVTMVATAGLCAVTLLAGWGQYWPGFVHNLLLSSSGTSNALNQSLNGVVLRWLHPELTGQPNPALDTQTRLTWLALQLGLVAAALPVVLRESRDDLDEWAQYSCMLLVLLLVSPFSWPHHYAQALVALPVGVRLGTTGRLPRASVVAGVATLAVLLAFESPASLQTLALGTSVARHPFESLAGSMLVFAALVWVAMFASARGPDERPPRRMAAGGT